MSRPKATDRYFRRHGAIVLSMGMALLSACSPSARDPSVDAPNLGATATEVPIEFSGCATLFASSRCALKLGGALDLWIGTTDPRSVDVRIGHRRVDLVVDGSHREGGISIRILPAALPSTLTLTPLDAPDATVFSLALEARIVPGWDQDVRALIAVGKHAEARELLSTQLQSSADADRGELLSRRARVHMHARDWVAAESDLVAAIHAHRGAGRPSDAVTDVATLAYYQITRSGDSLAATATLKLAPELLSGDARSRLLLDGTHALVARSSGDFGTADRIYRDAILRARRLGDAQNEAMVRVGLANTRAELGDFARATEMLQDVPSNLVEQLTHCDQARFLNTRAWIALLTREAGLSSQDPVMDLDQAHHLLQTPSCAFLTSDRSNVALNLALAHVQHGDTRAARAALNEAEQINATMPALQQAWRMEIEARVLLAEGDARAALEAYRNLERRSNALLMLDSEWRAALGAAASRRAVGDIDAAILDLERADRLLTDYLSDLPSLDARALFLARYESLPRRWVEYLLELNRFDEAFQVARRYRNEPLRRMQQSARIGALDAASQERWRGIISRYQELRLKLDATLADEWTLPTHQLEATRTATRSARESLHALVEEAAAMGMSGTAVPSPLRLGEHELVLSYFPVLQDWAVFSFDGQRVRAARISAPDPKAELSTLSRQLLESFNRELAQTQRLRVMAYGPLLDLDFHRLLWNGKPLDASMGVVYAADLAEPERDDDRSAHVLLVADPMGDLPAARAEVANIERHLRSLQPKTAIERLQGSQASVTAINAALTRSTLFHFAGHSEQFQDGGTQPGFALADGQSMEVGDILMLDRAPRSVVLATCDSARAAAHTPGQAMSLAHAFLVSGSSEVVATMRPIADRESARFSASLHGLHAEGWPLELALGESQRRLFEIEPDGDWSAFRVYIR